MLYSELIAEIADRTDLPQKDAKAVIATFVQVVTDCARNDEDVAVNGLGIFKSDNVPDRTANNPRNPGEKILVPAHKVLRLQVSKAMKGAIN